MPELIPRTAVPSAWPAAARARRVGLVFSVVLLTLFVAFGVERWRIWAMSGALALIVGSMVADRVRGPAPTTQKRLLGHLTLIFVAQAAGIWATGGIRSPFAPVFIPTVLIAGLLLGRSRSLVAVLGLPVVMLWAMLAVDLSTGPGQLLPWFLDWRTPLGSRLYPLIFTIVITMICTVGVAIGLSVRRAIASSEALTLASERQRLESMGERNRELRGLLAELAHELRNPLHAVLGISTNMLRKVPDDSRDQARLDVMVGEVKRMSGIVDDFLALSRPLARLRVERIELRHLALELTAIHEAVASDAQVCLVVEPGPALYVNADRAKLKQLLLNILHNALDATPRGGQIRLRVAPDSTHGPGARIEVSDTGPGFSAELRHRLFERGITTKAQGSGLGLAISRTIARHHGGELAIGEPSGATGGATLVLTLPTEPTCRALEPPG